MITLHNGDLFTVEADALAHGVNTLGVMGGIAGAFDKKFPRASNIYHELCDLGMLLPGGHYNGYEEGKFILHVVSQDMPGADATPERFLLGLSGAVNELIVDRPNDKERLTVALPLIGCGIGGMQFEDFWDVLTSVSFMYKEWVDFVVVYNDLNADLIPDAIKVAYGVDTETAAL